MKEFHSEQFLGEDMLSERNVKCPMRLTYYMNEQENEHGFGIEVVKTEYREEGVKIESKKIDNLTKDKNSVNECLEKLSRGAVTPISVEEIVNEYFPFAIAKYKEID